MTAGALERRPADPWTALVAETIAELLETSAVVAPLDVLLRLELVEPDAVEDWRQGKLPYLERGITTGLARVARTLRLVGEHCRALGLRPAPGKYARRGKASRQRLRFSKRGDDASERAYATHYVRGEG